MVCACNGEAERQLGIAALNVRIPAIHTHSMPSFHYFLPSGAPLRVDFQSQVEKKIIEALPAGQGGQGLPAEPARSARAGPSGPASSTAPLPRLEDRRPIHRAVDRRRLAGGSTPRCNLPPVPTERPARCPGIDYSSRTRSASRTRRPGRDWPGMVEEQIRARRTATVSFLYRALRRREPGSRQAVDRPADGRGAARGGGAGRGRRSVAPGSDVDQIRVESRRIELAAGQRSAQDLAGPLSQRPGGSAAGVNGSMSPPLPHWFQSASKWDFQCTGLNVPMSAMLIGPIGLVFHPAELYSVYGLLVRRDSPFPDTLVVLDVGPTISSGQRTRSAGLSGQRIRGGCRAEGPRPARRLCLEVDVRTQPARPADTLRRVAG